MLLIYWLLNLDYRHYLVRIVVKTFLMQIHATVLQWRSVCLGSSLHRILRRRPRLRLQFQQHADP